MERASLCNFQRRLFCPCSPHEQDREPESNREATTSLKHHNAILFNKEIAMTYATTKQSYPCAITDNS